jgi:hypothetical protein
MIRFLPDPAQKVDEMINLAGYVNGHRLFLSEFVSI